MQSHVRTQTHLVNNQCDEEDEEGNEKQLMAFYHHRLRDTREKEARSNEEEMDEEKVEKHEHESISSGSDHELGDCQSSSSVDTPSSATWSYRDTDIGDDSDRVAFVSSPLPSQSQSCYEDSRENSPSANQRSIVSFIMLLHLDLTMYMFISLFIYNDTILQWLIGNGNYIRFARANGTTFSRDV